MFENLFLEPQQQDLLVTFVESFRRVPDARRQPFTIIAPLSGTGYRVLHPGWSGDGDVYFGDVDALIAANLLAPSRLDSDMYEITPQGFAYYRDLKQREEDPVQRVETELRRYLDGEPFRQRYPDAYRKWAKAEERLWADDPERELTGIGHDCREALQAFATALMERFRPPDVNPNKARDIARLQAVLQHRAAQLGTTERPFLEALLGYWATLSELVQRQEHGAQREGPPLAREDGLRIVFQTAVVMFEIDRSVSRSPTVPGT